MPRNRGDSLTLIRPRPLASAGKGGSSDLLLLAGRKQIAGDLGEAVRLYQAAIAADPKLGSNPQLQAIMAKVLMQAGRFEEVIPCCAKLIELEPDRTEAYEVLGTALRALGRPSLAVGAFAMVVHLDRLNAQAHNSLGNALQEAGRLGEAELAYREAAGLFPDNSLVLCNLAALLIRTGHYAQALTLCDEALALEPGSFHGIGNRSVALSGLGRHEEAIVVGREALALKPHEPEAQHNLAVWLLTIGQMTAEAWELLEGRHGLRGMVPRTFDVPQWLGEDPSGKTILIHAAAGFGDTLQFARYIPLLVEQGARVIVEAYTPLHRLFRDLDGIVALVSQGDPLPFYDMHCSFESLPRAFRTTLETIPSATSWLRWEGPRGLPRSGRALRVGLVWAGNRNFVHDQQRSVALTDLLPLWEVPGVAFISLQAGVAAEDLSGLPPAYPIEDPMRAITDYMGTAEIIATLDLVVCVDTSVAHLAGSMGVRVWMLSRHNGCWRWLLDRSDTPWYPTMTIYRQPAGEGWASVVQAVGSNLALLAAAAEQ